jgi:hypothetical protein
MMRRILRFTTKKVENWNMETAVVDMRRLGF